MANVDNGAHALLAGLSAMSEAFIDLARLLRDKPGVSSVEHRVDIRDYQEIPTLEAYIDVETTKGLAYCWWLDLRSEGDKWVVEASLRQVHDNGQDLVTQFPVRDSTAVADLLEHLRYAVDDLVKSATKFNFVDAK